MVLGTGAYTWATRVEPHWLEISYAKLSLEGMPTAWSGKRLVQVSDFHLGSTDPAYLLRVLEQVNVITRMSAIKVSGANFKD